MLCPLDQTHAVRPTGRTGTWLLGLVLALIAPVGWSQTPAAYQPAPGHQALFEQASAWVAKTQGLDVRQIEFKPLDARISIPACQHGVVFDQPFPNPYALRASCHQPTWQFFLSQVPKNRVTASPLTHSVGMVVRKVWVTNQLIRRGTTLSAHLFEARELSVSQSDNAYITQTSDLENMQALRDLPAGAPIRSFDIKPALLVLRGQLVTVSVGEGRGFNVVIRAESLQDGKLGEQIRLKNTDSGRLLSAMVIGPNTAKGL